MTARVDLGEKKSEQIQRSVIPQIGSIALLKLLEADFGIVDKTRHLHEDAEIANDLTERNDYYKIFSFYEKDCLSLAQEAWKIHASGYRDMNFVYDTAIDENGFLYPDIDKARGPNVQYYLAIDPNNPTDCGTMRRIEIPEGYDFTCLPAYKACKDNLTAEGLELLKTVSNQSRCLKEIAALSKTAQSSRVSIYELLRSALHDGIKDKEVWLFSLVASTHDSLVVTMGNDVFTILGPDIAFEDKRIAQDVRLRPLLLDTNTYLDTLYGSYLTEIDPRKKRFYLRSFRFFSDGLDESLMSKDIIQARQLIA